MRAIPFAAALALAVTPAAFAADIAAAQQEPLPPAVVEGPTFPMTAYFWATAINGRNATLPPLPPAEFDESSGDILKGFNGGISAAGELRMGAGAC